MFKGGTFPSCPLGKAPRDPPTARGPREFRMAPLKRPYRGRFAPTPSGDLHPRRRAHGAPRVARRAHARRPLRDARTKISTASARCPGPRRASSKICVGSGSIGTKAPISAATTRRIVSRSDSRASESSSRSSSAKGKRIRASARGERSRCRQPRRTARVTMARAIPAPVARSPASRSPSAHAAGRHRCACASRPGFDRLGGPHPRPANGRRRGDHR